MIFGVYGALRCQEITNIETTDIKEHGQMFLVSIHETKTKVSKSFGIMPEHHSLIKNYMMLRPQKSTTDFLLVIKTTNV